MSGTDSNSYNINTEIKQQKEEKRKKVSRKYDQKQRMTKTQKTKIEIHKQVNIDI